MCISDHLLGDAYLFVFLRSSASSIVFQLAGPVVTFASVCHESKSNLIKSQWHNLRRTRAVRFSTHNVPIANISCLPNLTTVMVPTTDRSGLKQEGEKKLL